MSGVAERVAPCAVEVRKILSDVSAQMVTRFLDNPLMIQVLKQMRKDPQFRKKYNCKVRWVEGSQRQEDEEEEVKEQRAEEVKQPHYRIA